MVAYRLRLVPVIIVRIMVAIISVPTVPVIWLIVVAGIRSVIVPVRIVVAGVISVVPGKSEPNTEVNMSFRTWRCREHKTPAASAINKKFVHCFTSQSLNKTIARKLSRLFVRQSFWIASDAKSLPDPLILNVAQLQCLRSFCCALP